MAGGDSAGELGGGQPRRAVEGGKGAARRVVGLSWSAACRRVNETAVGTCSPSCDAGGEVAADWELRGAPAA